MKAYRYILAAMVAAASLSSCSDVKDTMVGEGTVMISATISSDITESRTSSSDLADELGDTFEFWLTSENDGGVIRLYEGLDNLPSSLILSTGHYVAEAWAGDSISASFDTRWFKSYVPFDVTSGASTQVDMTLKIANVVVDVEYGDGVLDAYAIDSLYVSHKRGSLTFIPNETSDRGYFMMPSTDQNLSWICICHRKSDNALREFTGTLQNVEAAHLYTFKITYTPAEADTTEHGGTYFDIAIDTTEEAIYETVELLSSPIIQGVYDGEAFDLSETFTTTVEPGAVGVYVTACSDLENVYIASDLLIDYVGLSSNSVDLMTNLDSTTRTLLTNAGMSWSYTYTSGSYNLMITFSNTFTEYLDWDEEYDITITAIDDNKLQRVSTLSILKTQAPLSLPVSYEGGDTSAPITLTTSSFVAEGDIYTDDGSTIYVVYEDTSSRTLRQVEATKDGDTFSATLTGLTANTYYEYYYMMGSYTSSQTGHFTTESETQLENASFEEWQTSSAPYMVYASGGEMFWDTGNTGAATLGGNVTVPSTDYVNSGNYSIKLESQFVGILGIGKFAAGNVFIGKYLATSGTNGILGWGRSFTGRPTSMKGYVRYEQGTVDKTSSSWTELTSGDPDEGIIYWALLDDTLIDYTYSGTTYSWPVIVNTADIENYHFDSTASNVIAYGELRFTTSTDGSGLVEFEIPLEYYRTDLRPTYIMCTCAASRGGDYFVGSTSSVMYLDDLELVYE